MERAPGAGGNLAALRGALGVSRAALARGMGIPVSRLRLVEDGLRPLSPAMITDAAGALGVGTARITGEPFPGPSEHARLLDGLRDAVRRHTLPREDVPPPEVLAAGVRRADALRAETRYLELLRELPELLGQATATALVAEGEPEAWARVADLYGCAYAAAHRLAQADLADMIVSRQQWAAQRTWNPAAEAAACWNEAGTFQSAGQYAEGLAVVERAIGRYEHVRGEGPEAVIVLGSLHLRGVVLASRHRDKAATRDHLRHARRLAAQLSGDELVHNLTFGEGNTALYELAAHIELDQPGEAVRMAAPLERDFPPGLRPNRIGRFFIDLARARLATRDLPGAEEALRHAFRVAPQMAEVHPMSREVLRVLFVLHQRSRPELLTLARRTGLAP
ncbi:helix-turn-helix transcriptional regulator [Streptomyces sp. LP05-1]|uniref:Helix-turn-helix transcriptional regulator n=1 Tax=Streptomyces pyxinae TaxID=2970734 RepID=A0ABT2CNE4_9ACTN|nr:helix-turn-helix transcriptional regulator [Streptomyces sp. LP05-1]MCS0638958.1 helix-turn-helix transcriptional regulator [Streptomyces sp. LP05-1]